MNAEKLRAILLLETDFDILYKIIFNKRLILNLEISIIISLKIIDNRHL